MIAELPGSTDGDQTTVADPAPGSASTEMGGLGTPPAVAAAAVEKVHAESEVTLSATAELRLNKTRAVRVRCRVIVLIVPLAAGRFLVYRIRASVLGGDARPPGHQPSDADRRLAAEQGCHGGEGVCEA